MQIMQYVLLCKELTFKALIGTAAGHKFCDLFLDFRDKWGLILHENCLQVVYVWTY